MCASSGSTTPLSLIRPAREWYAHVTAATTVAACGPGPLSPMKLTPDAVDLFKRCNTDPQALPVADQHVLYAMAVPMVCSQFSR